jgi:hypothetical protein
MSDLHSSDPVHGHGHGEHVRSEDDHVSTGKIVGVGVASLVIFFVASLLTVMYLRGRQSEHGPMSTPPELGQSKIGMVEQQLFDVAVRGLRDRDERRERLRSYGWVNRDAGVAHMPIERAMELVIQGVRPQPPAQAEPPRPPGAQP